jgi:hypothetical protein
VFATQREYLTTIAGFCHDAKVLSLADNIFYGKPNDIMIVNDNDLGRIVGDFDSLTSVFFQYTIMSQQTQSLNLHTPGNSE